MCVQVPLPGVDGDDLVLEVNALRSTDYYMPGPAYILQNGRVSQGITGFSLPSDEDYNVDYVFVSHHRTDNSPLHNWLWQEITCTIRDLRPEQPRKLRQRLAAGSVDNG